MKNAKSLLAVVLVLLWSGAVLAQDPSKVDAAHYKVVFDNPSVRVLKVDYAAGAKGVMHHHPDAIVIPLVASKVRFAAPDGKSEDRELPAESGLYTPAGDHTPTNIGTGPVSAILVEFKAAAPGKATLPSARPGMTMKVLAEGPHGMAYRSTAEPTFQEAAGTKHDFDQVVISLSATSGMSLSIAGQPAKTTWARGDAVFVPRGIAHEAKNTSGKTVDFVIVAIK